MILELSTQRLSTLVGLLDVAIKSVGIRAMEDDVLELMQALKALNSQQAQEAAPTEEAN